MTRGGWYGLIALGLAAIAIVVVLILSQEEVSAPDVAPEDLELSETFTGGGTLNLQGELTMQYPESWAIQSDPLLGILFSNDDESLSVLLAGESIESGQIAGLISGLPVTVLDTIDDEDGIDALEVLDVAAGSLFEGAEDVETQDMTIEGREIAYITATLEDVDQNIDNALFVTQAGEGFVSMLVSTPEDEIAAYLPVLQAMAASIEVEPAAVEPEVTEEVTPEATLEITAEVTAEVTAAP